MTNGAPSVSDVTKTLKSGDDGLLDDEDFFPDDDTAAGTPAAPAAAPWVVLVVDDEPDVHAITRMALGGMEYKGRRLDLLGARTGAEALAILSSRSDIAIVLLDVVMETDDAGLRVVRTIREELGNSLVRIVLRTGQPGQAPEREVIVNYDINDYKAKTELTQDRLFTTVVTALRGYDDLMQIETSRRILDANRRGLEKVVGAAASLFQARAMHLFASGVLTQIGAILDVDCEGILCARVEEARGAGPQIRVIAASGRYEPLVDSTLDRDGTAGDPTVIATIRRAIEEERSVFAGETNALYVRTPDGRHLAVYLHTRRNLTELDRRLLEVFTVNVSVGLDNLHLYEDVKRAQRATVLALADLAEYKDNATGDHVLRVARMTEAIARTMRQRGLDRGQADTSFLEQVGTASILHDVGKVSIPDQILLKPGPLDAQERDVMMGHAANGGGILKRAADMVGRSEILHLAAEIAIHHHERWDGAGYPKGLAGTDIPLGARIVAVSDVFDALMHKRPYKPAWPLDQALDYIRGQAGKQFDPAVVEAFLAVVESGGPGPEVEPRPLA